MMNKFYNCPKCNARHSIDAWDYKTRKELEIDDIDATDITCLGEEGAFNNKYYCPTCHQSSIKLRILQHDHETQALRFILSYQLDEINGTMQHLELYDHDKNEYFVSWDSDEFEWVISNSFDEHEFVEAFNKISDTVEYLLGCGVAYDLGELHSLIVNK